MIGKSGSAIHVVLVVHRFDAGGMERYIAALANGLPVDRFRVSVLCMHRSGTARQWITRDDTQVVELGIVSGQTTRLISLISAALHRLQPSIVHSHNWSTLVATYFAVRRHRAVVHVHGERGSVLGSDNCSPLKRKLRSVVIRWICRRIALTTNSHRVAATISSNTGVEPSRIHVIPNGLDLAASPAQLAAARITIRQQLSFSQHDLVVGTIARLAKVKNLGLALRALHETPPELRNRLHILLVGDGPCRDELHAQAEKLDLSERVHFVGHQWETWKYLAAMDVFFNCSHNEGMSQSMLEAMAAGLPVIATDVGEAVEVLLSSSPCGLVVTPQDYNAMSEAFVTLSAAGYRESLGNAALARHRERYRLSTMLDGYQNLYCQLAAQSQGS